jgi:hypothetical protein
MDSCNVTPEGPIHNQTHPEILTRLTKLSNYLPLNQTNYLTVVRPTCYIIPVPAVEMQ